MFKQLVRDSFRVLRRPTVKTFQSVTCTNWRWALIYLVIGTAVTTFISVVGSIIQAPAREQQRLEFLQRYGSSAFTTLLTYLQKPLFTIILGISGIFIIFFLWILFPYWLGRAFGGAKSFGNFAYNISIFSTPISILDSLLALTLSSLAGGLFLFLSFSLDIFRFYLVYVNLQAAMGLPKGKSAVVVLVPILLAVFLCCGLAIFFSVAAFYHK